MTIPIRCFTCGNPKVGRWWLPYLELRRQGCTSLQALHKLSIQRFCCRQMILSAPPDKTAIHVGSDDDNLKRRNVDVFSVLTMSTARLTT